MLKYLGVSISVSVMRWDEVSMSMMRSEAVSVTRG